ncbi:hypothetical protein SCA03_43620 [Streptomyces cacaoi]|uniref:Uncharacterized protein n=2 Tax=Streptomyces cacaoi TaxID=1898 RepID=A0A4Y3R2J8_STRCI|nr:hypothetical protein SCA03_43620 [Streptomyces cacaoi]
MRGAARGGFRGGMAEEASTEGERAAVRGSRGNTRDAWAWVAPSLASVLVAPVLAHTFLALGVARLTCDTVCGPAVPHTVDPGHRAVTALLACCLTAGTALLCGSWALPRRLRNRRARVCFALAAVPLTVCGALLLHAGG